MTGRATRRTFTDTPRYENQMRNQVFTTPPTTGLVPPYYPGLVI